VVLQPNRSGTMLAIVAHSAVRGGSIQFLLVVHEHTVVINGDDRRLQHFAVLAELRHVKLDVISLPFAGRAAGVYQRRMLTVQRRALAVGVAGVLVGVENLHFVLAAEKHAAVAAPLAIADHLLRCGEFHVQFNRAKFLFTA